MFQPLKWKAAGNNNAGGLHGKAGTINILQTCVTSARHDHAAHAACPVQTASFKRSGVDLSCVETPMTLRFIRVCDDDRLKPDVHQRSKAKRAGPQAQGQFTLSTRVSLARRTFSFNCATSGRIPGTLPVSRPPPHGFHQCHTAMCRVRGQELSAKRGLHPEVCKKSHFTHPGSRARATVADGQVSRLHPPG